MPGLDGTGPRGRGSMTGRGLGRCNPDSKIQNDRPFGRGLGRGCGRGFGGRGFRRNWEMIANKDRS
jgi:hypothetical protein